MPPPSLTLPGPSGDPPFRSRKEGGSCPVVSLVMDHYFPEIHAGVVKAARELGWDLDDARCRGYHGSMFPKNWNPDGVLATTATDPCLDWVRQCGVPVVRLLEDAAPSSFGQTPDDIPSVVLGRSAAGRIAAQHLLSLGTPHLVYHKYYQDREDESLFRAFVETCRAQGREPMVLDFPAEHPDFAPSYVMPRPRRLHWLQEKIASLPRPCALMADDDRFAIEVVLCAAALGLRVPEDVAVLGCEDLSLVHGRSEVPLSSIDMNLSLLGRTAARILDGLLQGGPPPPRRTVVPPKRLVERQSTATFVCPEPAVSRTVLRIRRDFAEPLTVVSLAREAGLSVRSLQRLYRETTGTTISQALKEKRLEAAASLLRETTFKLDPIAMETGLGNAKNLWRLFKEHFGVTPGQWREAPHDLPLSTH